MIAGSADAPCPGDEAFRYAQRIPTMANFVMIEDGDHGVFGWYSADEYVSLLTRELTDVAPEEMNVESVTFTFEGIEFDDYDGWGGKDGSGSGKGGYDSWADNDNRDMIIASAVLTVSLGVTIFFVIKAMTS